MALPKGIRDIDALAYVINVAPDPRLVRKVVERGISVVITDWFDPRLRADGVVIDNEAATTLVMQHLFRLKHRRIAFINSLSGQSADERHRAYRSSLEKAGLRYDPDLVVAVRGIVLEGQQAMRSLDKGPTAVFTFNDYQAIGAFLAAQAGGLSVPRDFSIAGFGSQGEPLAQGLGLKLTTIRIDYVEMGRAAASVPHPRHALDGRYDRRGKVIRSIPVFCQGLVICVDHVPVLRRRLFAPCGGEALLPDDVFEFLLQAHRR